MSRMTKEQMFDQDASKIIVTGNPVDGFEFYGPFAVLDDDTCNEFEGDWWVARLWPLPVPPRCEEFGVRGTQCTKVLGHFDDCTFEMEGEPA